MTNQRKEFSKIYDKYIEKIYRFCYLKVSSEDIAKDLTSETFVKGWEAYQIQKIDNVQAFLYRIAHNLTVDYYRQKGRTTTVSVDDVQIVEQAPNIGAKVDMDADIGQIKAHLAGLKEDYQNVIIWHYLDDLPIKKVAEMMGKTEETTRVTLHRALKSLKGKMNVEEA